MFEIGVGYQNSISMNTKMKSEIFQQNQKVQRSRESWRNSIITYTSSNHVHSLNHYNFIPIDNFDR